MPSDNHLSLKALTVLLAMFTASIVHAGSDLGLTSPAFENSATIPKEYTCSGADQSPPLKWKATAPSAKSLVLIVDDPDAPGGTFTHWVLYNVPPSVTGLPSNVEKKPVLSDRGQQGKNDFGKYGYGGPCPPPGPIHHYYFRLSALDTTLDLEQGASADEVRSAMKGHEVSSAELVGTFGR